MALMRYMTKQRGKGEKEDKEGKVLATASSSDTHNFLETPSAPPTYSDVKVGFWFFSKKISVSIEIRTALPQTQSPLTLLKLASPFVDEYSGPDGLYWPSLSLFLVAVANMVEVSSVGTNYSVYKQAFCDPYKIWYRGPMFQVAPDIVVKGTYTVLAGKQKATVRYNISYKDTKMQGAPILTTNSKEGPTNPLTETVVNVMTQMGFQKDVEANVILFNSQF